MKWLLTLLILFMPMLAFGETTKPTSFQVKYANFITWDKEELRTGDGISISIEFPQRRTRFDIGFFNSNYESKWGKEQPVVISVNGNAELSDISFNLDFDINGGDLSYKSRTHSDVYDIYIAGNYGYFTKTGTIGKEISKTRLDKSWTFDMYVTGGAKLDISTNSTEYNLYMNGKKFDTITNPLSGTETSGIKFFLGKTLAFRFSHAIIDISAGISIPTINKSFILINAGIAL